MDKKKLEKLLNNLPLLPNIVYDKVAKDFVEGFVKPRGFIRDGMLFVSGEEGDDACDYYGEYRGGFPFINPILEKFAADNGCYFEFENAGCLVLCEK